MRNRRQLRKCATDLLCGVGAMATEGLDNLLALGAGASASAVASEEVGAEEDPAARALALARALGHNKDYNDAGTMELVDTIARKLGGWRKALRGAGPEDLAWCRALVLFQLHERSFASLKELKEKDTKLKADGWECRALLLELCACSTASSSSAALRPSS